MKVGGTGRSGTTGRTSKTSKKDKVSGAKFGALLSGGEEAVGSTPSMAPASPAGRIDALLSVQEADDATEGKKHARAQVRAEDMLDQLELLRLGLLTGVIPEGHLNDLSRVIQSHRENIIDPDLMQILDEIDLRAQVELAKLSNVVPLRP